jgi:transcriptional regulator with XRE-family HTH domain
MFGHELRKARLAAGLTQEELSYEAELDRTYISHLENGHKSPTLDVLFRLSDALGVKASELVQKVEALRPQPKKKRSRRI